MFRLKFLNDILCKTNLSISECREKLDEAENNIKQVRLDGSISCNQNSGSNGSTSDNYNVTIVLKAI